jgi:hypothetical protein
MPEKVFCFSYPFADPCPGESMCFQTVIAKHPPGMSGANVSGIYALRHERSC